MQTQNLSRLRYEGQNPGNTFRDEPRLREAKTSKSETHTLVSFERLHDTQTGMLLGMPRSARCVQRFDDSLDSAIHITYHISLCSSSMREPRDPLLKVVFIIIYCQPKCIQNVLNKNNVIDTRRCVYTKCTGGKEREKKLTRTLAFTLPPGPAQQAPSQKFNSIMILPQVHLRKPCYDFYFL